MTTISICAANKNICGPIIGAANNSICGANRNPRGTSQKIAKILLSGANLDTTWNSTPSSKSGDDHGFHSYNLPLLLYLLPPQLPPLLPLPLLPLPLPRLPFSPLLLSRFGWLIVVALLLPLFLPLLSAPPLLMLSGITIATVAAAKTTAPVPSAATAATAFFAAVTTSSLFPLPTANVSAVQTLPLILPPPHHCLCLQCLCRHRFRHGSHHCLKLPSCRSVGASKGW